MHILVTGGTGYAGSHLINELIKNGHKVTVLVRGHTRTDHLKDATLLTADLGDPNALASANTPLDVDVIYHMVSNFLEPTGRSLTVESTRNLLRYYDNCPLKQLIYFSNTVVYGDTHGKVITESDHPVPNTAHGHHKLMAEQLIQASGHPYTILRGSQYYGSSLPSVVSSFDWIVLGPVLEGKLPLIDGGKDQRVGMIHIDDMIQVALLVLNNPKAIGEIFNACSGDITVTNRDVFYLITDMANVTPARDIPKIAALSYAWVSEKWATLRGKQPGFIPDMVRILYQDRVYSIDKARNLLGYQPQYARTLDGLRSAYGHVIKSGKVVTNSRLSEVRS